MNPHQLIVDYAVSKGEDSWRVGIDATRAVRQIESHYSWQTFVDDCPHCGGQAEVFTSTGKDNSAYDGDAARCSVCNCPGSVTVTEEPDAYVNWHDEVDCDCEWCKSHPDV